MKMVCVINYHHHYNDYRLSLIFISFEKKCHLFEYIMKAIMLDMMLMNITYNDGDNIEGWFFIFELDDFIVRCDAC